MRVDFTKAYHEETDRLLAIPEKVEKLSETRKPSTTALTTRKAGALRQ
jgi:hypothetical protein